MKRIGFGIVTAYFILFAFFILGCAGGGASNNIAESEGSVSEEADAGKPNVIMIVVDTLRYGHLSTSGYGRDTSPNLEEFKATSTSFKKAISAAPWTMPSYTSMLLAKHAFNHNMNLSTETGPIDGTILPLLMNDEGYRTVSIQTNYFMDYIDYDFNEIYHYFDDETLNDVDAVAKAVEWLSDQENTKENFFMFIGLMSPHWPYRPDTGYLEEFVKDELYNNSTAYIFEDLYKDGSITFGELSEQLRGVLGEPQDGYYKDSRLYIAAYDGEIKFADEQVGILLSALKEKGLFDDSIIIITADHGENMIDHTPYFAHSDSLYNTLIHVPLFIKLPNQETSRVIGEYVRLIDVLPTVFDYIGLDPGDVDGKTLMPLINGTGVDIEDRPVISYDLSVYSGRARVSVIRDEYKFIDNEEVDELYYLDTDPGETFNLASSKPETVDYLKGYLDTFYSVD